MNQILNKERELKWPEVYSLAALNAAVVISWIAYHEYQPVILENFSFDHMTGFLTVTKAIVLIMIPPIAGLFADYMLKTRGKYFIIFTVGVGATAMIFMVVASIIGAGPVSQVKPFLPYMIVFWLIAMNLFISPAYSMIEAFAPAQKLPVVMGFLFLVTELIYALEPLVVMLVQFFGETLTFVVGGLLISGTGILFHRISSDEVVARKKELMESKNQKTESMAFVAIIVIGLLMGAGKAFLVEFFPSNMTMKFPEMAQLGQYISFALLGFSAILAFASGNFVSKIGVKKVLPYSFLTLLIGVLIIIFSGELFLMLIGGVIVAASFSIINISGLPFAINHLSVRHITYGVGIFIGASEVFSGLMEYYLI